MNEKGKCAVCGEEISTLRDGTLRRHAGKEQFDIETDGICSGSYGLPEESSRKG